METKEKEYTVKDIAFEEGVSARTVYRWCSSGFLLYSRNPTGKNKGGISIKEADYKMFKKIFVQIY